MREILNIPLTPQTLFTIHEKTGMSQAELEVLMSNADRKNEVTYFRIETLIETMNHPKPKEK